MKKLCTLLVVLCLLCLPDVGCAEVKEFERFSIDVPEGWSESVAKGMVLLLSPGSKCVVTVALQPSDGLDAQTFARNLAGPLKGSPPEGIVGSRGFTFTANVGGVNTRTRVQVYEDKALIFSVAGETAAYKDAVNAIWQSLDSREEAIRTLIRN